MALRMLRGTLEAEGELYYKGLDGVVIPGARKKTFYPFSAPGWMDLRVGFFLSLTKAADPDSITTLGQTISGATAANDRYWIGLRNQGGAFPRTAGCTFIGYTNSRPVDGSTEPASDSILTSSDEGVGNTNTNFWRPLNSVSNDDSAMIIDGTDVLDGSQTGMQQHFPQNVEAVGGYALLLGMRLMRESITSREVQVSFKSTTLSGDMLYSSDPSLELLSESITNWPIDVQLLVSGADMSEVPTGFFFYWPWTNSRLRIHSVGLKKAL
jgi:hypothetical protein